MAELSLRHPDDTVVLTGQDDVGVIPPSLPYGLAVTFNHGAYGGVDFWNLTESTEDGQGFAFHQKLTDNTEQTIAWLGSYIFAGVNASSFEIHASTPNSTVVVYVDGNGSEIYGGAAAPLIVSLGERTFANLQSYYGSYSIPVGVIACITDSMTNVWGAVITGGGAYKVLGFYNGTNWTVFAK